MYKCRWRGIIVATKCIKSNKNVKLLRDVDTIWNTPSSISDKHTMTSGEMAAALNDFRLEINNIKTFESILMLHTTKQPFNSMRPNSRLTVYGQTAV